MIAVASGDPGSPGRATTDTLADDLADGMRETGAGRDATIVGFSMGGGEIARYMNRYDGKGVVAAA